MRRQPDFPRIIGNLESSGLDRPTIARKVGVSPSTISRICSREVQDPRYSTGANLVELAGKIEKAGR